MQSQKQDIRVYVLCCFWKYTTLKKLKQIICAIISNSGQTYTSSALTQSQFLQGLKKLLFLDSWWSQTHFFCQVFSQNLLFSGFNI